MAKSGAAASRKRVKAAPSPLADVDWIAELAEPYLRGYHAVKANGGGLQGWWFEAPKEGSKGERGEYGFFAGYLVDAEPYPYLNSEAPECLVFAWFANPSGVAHKRLVTPPESLLRKINEYIRWLTHRPPRFQFFEDEEITLVRHRPMSDWPQDKIQHYSRNFFIETCAWLVRSGLVKKLLEAGRE